MAAPNIVEVSTITGKVIAANATTTLSNVLTNVAESGKVFKVNSLYATNINSTSTGNVTASVLKSGVDFNLAYLINVPSKSTLVIISKDTSIYLEENDSIRIQAGSDNHIQAVVSYEEIS